MHISFNDKENYPLVGIKEHQNFAAKLNYRKRTENKRNKKDEEIRPNEQKSKKKRSEKKPNSPIGCHSNRINLPPSLHWSGRGDGVALRCYGNARMILEYTRSLKIQKAIKVT
ncbi:hypothetical protein AVEN_105228-1 [Araneus ventricosus]|uniref:Uncharacterized protein n=1 Tax=Araneus ventricosus TaxID=182803 RepID=A0A4Y2JL56_ARAVE|nr:hypothetical protein AVEN_105228-1 [Araneus ventricosus]